MIEVLFDARPTSRAKVSIVLLDWSCRESFHMLGYLDRQTVPRDWYEVMWIEYYGRQAAAIAEAVRDAERPKVDQWIVMGMPDGVYYHKHLMYNVGLVASRGELVVLCDSDTMVKPTFVEAIVGEFERGGDIVLHLDEVRNNDRRFYPFNHPSFEDVVGPGAINWTGQTTAGLVDAEDPLHTRNYGACMVARRADLIVIGGADEHLDYLGHICGPYELTFRLVNAGKREVWHPTEFLYHTWHPGQAGDKNYLGPHDGRHMSTTALAARQTGRIDPLVENPAVQALRLGLDPVRFTPLLEVVIPEVELPRWTVDPAKRLRTEEGRVVGFRHPRVLGPLLLATTGILVRQTWVKTAQLARRATSMRERLTKLGRAYRFVRGVLQHVRFVIQSVRQSFDRLVRAEVPEIAIFGATEVAQIVIAVSRAYPVRVVAVYDDVRRGRVLGYPVRPLEELKDSEVPVVVAAVVGVEGRVGRLRGAGVPDSRIVRLA